MKPFFVSIPHSGEKVPDEVDWLQGLPEPVLMCDVDRFVDVLYRPALEQTGVPFVIAQWHRYVVDLNRLPDDVDQSSVEGAPHPSGAFTTGFHWVKTTRGHQLIKKPMSMDVHRQLTQRYFEPFHQQVRDLYQKFKSLGHQSVFHIDAHSMPSQGTAAHRDPGQRRPEIVVSDVDGRSCQPEFKNLVIDAYKGAGFEVAYNWPYKGGRLTQTYGKPEIGQHVVQVEMNRALYMDEETKRMIPDLAKTVQTRVKQALTQIYQAL